MYDSSVFRYLGIFLLLMFLFVVIMFVEASSKCIQNRYKPKDFLIFKQE